MEGTKFLPVQLNPEDAVCAQEFPSAMGTAQLPKSAAFGKTVDAGSQPGLAAHANSTTPDEPVKS